MAVLVQVLWRARWRIDHTASWPRQPRSRGGNIDINLDADLDAVPDDNSKQTDEHADDHSRAWWQTDYGDKQSNEHADEHFRQWCSSKLSSVEVVEVFSLTAIYKTKFLQSLLYCCCMNIYISACVRWIVLWRAHWMSSVRYCRMDWLLSLVPMNSVPFLRICDLCCIYGQF